jgi:hypothetical protein
MGVAEVPPPGGALLSAGRSCHKKASDMIRTADGQALKILVRGDCTSRRSIALNQDLFEKPPHFLQNEKSTFIQFVDAIDGVTVTEGFLRDITDVDAMGRILRSFYLGQAGRSILQERGADLLVLDSYADMNFQLWENQDEGFKLWVHPKFVYDLPKFKETHRSLGHRTLEQSASDAVRFVEYMRTLNPEVPVLFLNQQVDYYPKLSDRAADFEKLGELIANQLPGVFYGGVVDKEDLELADIGSAGGPGNTLHFQGPTYRRMWNRAINDGLEDSIRRRRELVTAATEPAATEPAATEPAPTEPAATEPAATEPSSAFADGSSRDGTAAAAQAGGAQQTTPQPGELTFTPSPTRNTVITETVELDLQVGSDCCVPLCANTYEDVRKTLWKYFYLDGRTEDGLPPRFTPMLVDLDEFETFDLWEGHIKKFSGGARLRHKRKAVDAGYYTKEFPRLLHVPDIYDINTSKDQRSGGPIRANLTRSIEDMGGAPDRKMGIPAAPCFRHWRKTFGVFLAEPGYPQGSVEVGERLVAYCSVQRRGELAVYNQMIGHGDHLSKGVLTLLHHDVVKHLYESPVGRPGGLRFIMYGGLQNGGEGLFQFKHRAGFKPYIVNVPPA